MRFASFSAAAALCLLTLHALVSQAQAPSAPPQRLTIQATAKGTSTQLGKVFMVNIHVEQFSTPEERKILMDAFNRSGHEGLVNALEKMKSKGRISTPWGTGNDLKYVFELPSEKGRRLRIVTDRRLAVGELRHSTRTEEYSIAAADLTLTPDGNGSGTLLPACKLKVDKKTQQLEIESYQNPWDLINFMVTKR